MTAETAAVMPQLMNGPEEAPQEVSPALPPGGASPPSSGGQGFIEAPPPAPQGMAPMPLPAVPTKPKLEKGQFTIKVVASIQQIYMMEQQKQDRLQGNLSQGMGLKPGWGGA